MSAQNRAAMLSVGADALNQLGWSASISRTRSRRSPGSVAKSSLSRTLRSRLMIAYARRSIPSEPANQTSVSTASAESSESGLMSLSSTRILGEVARLTGHSGDCCAGSPGMSPNPPVPAETSPVTSLESDDARAPCEPETPAGWIRPRDRLQRGESHGAGSSVLRPAAASGTVDA